MTSSSNREQTPSFVWLLTSSLWMLLALVPGPFLLWGGFAYIGFRSGKSSWKIAAAVYAALTVLATLYSIFIGNTSLTDSTALAIAFLFPIGIQLAGILHAAVANPTWLRIMWQQRERGVAAGGRERGRAPKETRSKEAAPLLDAPGLRSEDFFDDGPSPSGLAAPAEPIDVNTATTKQLAGLPGVSTQAAKKAVKARDARNGFASVDDFSEAAGLMPHQFLAVRAAATCSRRAAARQGFGRRVDL